VDGYSATDNIATLAPVADLPVLDIVSGSHIRADLTLRLGKVIHDYAPAWI